VTRAQALAHVDAIYAAKRRETWTKLLTAGRECDIEGVTALFADFDREYEETRARLVAWLDALPAGAILGAH
jgi:hypothetical protein